MPPGQPKTVVKRTGLCYGFPMIRIPAIAVLLAGLVSATAGADPTASPTRFRALGISGTFAERWKHFAGRSFCTRCRSIPISEKELRAISDRELDKDFPGPKLKAYEELLAWLDMVPPDTDLKAVYADFLVNQVAGLYDSETKEMCIPSFPSGTTNPAKKAAEKQLEEISAEMDDIVFAHEFTHALGGPVLAT